MKIPASHQVFDNTVVVSEKDFERLSPHLGNWTRLNDLLLLGVNESDLQRLVVIELQGSKRPQILGKLLARYGRARQVRLAAKVEELNSL